LGCAVVGCRCGGDPGGGAAGFHDDGKSSPTLSGFMNRMGVIGREERRLGARLHERGIEAVPQLKVWRTDEYGRYHAIDLAVWPLAIEVHTSALDPTYDNELVSRAVRLIQQGWIVGYLWLGKKEDFTDAALEALLEFRRDPGQDRYRVYGHDGKLMSHGDIAIRYHLKLEHVWRPPFEL
jgi:hypothetical protein